MGYSILELVLRRLREEGFSADAAYPGQMFPRITGTVAAAHIEKVDRDQLAVTIEVCVLTPAALGGGECEAAALRVTEILRWTGAVCVQNGCTYDGTAQLYRVVVLATYTGVTEAENCLIWPGFHCHINATVHPAAVAFGAVEKRNAEPVYSFGVPGAVGFHEGQTLWEITLEERIPVGDPEIDSQSGEFTLRIDLTDTRETYSGCRWTEIRREIGPGGVRRVRRGYARGKAVTVRE